jgi:hypothetical protein
MTYLHVLSPQGEPFEVVEQRVGKLLADGWTFNPAPLHVGDPVIVDDVVSDVAAPAPKNDVDGDAYVAHGLDPVADAQSFANDAAVTVDEGQLAEALPETDQSAYNQADEAQEDAPRTRRTRLS